MIDSDKAAISRLITALQSVKDSDDMASGRCKEVWGDGTTERFVRFGDVC